MTINFNTDPYYDDYDETKDFYRILFRPGVAVQARELTQIQTILQKQVSRVGDHLFKNGSQIIPGSVNVDNDVHFAKLNTTFNAVEVTSYLSNFQNMVITGSTSGVTAVVLDSSECNCVIDGTIPTLYFKYESTAADGETKRFLPGENLVAKAVDNTTANNYRLTANLAADLSVTISAPVGNTTYTNNANTDVIGRGYVVEVKEGIYYIDGLFVRNDELHLYTGRFSNTPTARVGFKVVEETITPEADTTLLDPAQGTYNYTAPGGHRYKVSLELTELPEESSGSDNIKFVELIRLKNGQVQSKINRTSYAELEKAMARRTYDANGHFEVDKFKLTKREHLDTGANNGVYTAANVAEPGDVNKFVMAIDAGRAYVYGYEVEAISTTFVSLDKARGADHTVEVESIPVGTPLGNYVLIDNLRDGYPDFTAYEQVNLVRAYTSAGSDHFSPGSLSELDEVVGTARVKSLEHHSGDYGSNPVFKLGLFDIKMNSGYSFTNDVNGIRDAAGVIGNVCYGANIVPDIDEGYVTGTATNTSGGSTTITGTGTLFINEFAIGDVVVINGSVAGQVTSITSNTELVLTNTSENANILNGRVQKLKTVLQDSEYPNLIYPVGYQYIKSLYNIDGTQFGTLSVRRVLNDTTDSSGNFSHTLSAQGETFLSDQNTENYTLFDNNGNIVDIDSGDISFDNDSNRKTVTISGLSNNTAYTLATTIRQSGTIGAEKTKTLQVGTTEDITGKKIVTGSRITLSKADVLRITDIQVTPGDYDTFDSGNAVSIFDSFTLDDGQRPTHYQAAALVLKANKKVPTGAIRVTYDYFTHGSAGNYFTVDSYTRPDNPAVGITYDEIGTTNFENGGTVNLSDVVDFRPVISGDNTSLNELPAIGTDLTTDLAYYLARIDKILLTSKGEFKIIKGVPSENPQEPADSDAGMVITTLFIPPYTKQVGDVKVRQRDNRRYTFKDLGQMERRMASLEEYVALDQLEKLTADLQITDPLTGIDRFKNGFITDQFSGHSLGDVKLNDYRAAVDPQNKTLRPMHFTSSLDIIEDVSDQAERAAAGYQKTGDVITLPYTEESLIFNPYASKAIDVNPYKIGAFNGEITLSPEGDNWKETDRRPDLVVTDNNGYDAIQFIAEELGITGTQWNEWETNWTGSSTSSRTWQTGGFGFLETVTTNTGIQSRTGVETNLSSAVNSVNYGDRVVDISYIPYMRSRPVTFTARNLKPDTKFFPFFDDKAVTDYVTPAQVMKVTLSAGSSYMDFDTVNLQGGVIADQYERLENGRVQPAFGIGDVLKNSTHTATNISAITHLTTAASTFTLTVASATGILPGHHVILYNLGANRAITVSPAGDNISIPESTISDFTKNTSEEINLNKFKVTAVSGTTITLANIDGTNINPFSAYDTTAYTSPDAGKLLRLTASGVVAFQGVLDDTTGTAGNVATYNRDIHVVNQKNGFAVGETLTGSITTAGGQINSVDIVSINGQNDVTTAAPVRTTVDDIRTDGWGSAVGVFNIPETDVLAFRTGERRFKLIDNRTNSEADFDSKGSVTYYSTGLSLSKEATVVNQRDVRFVEDRLYEELPVRRTSTSNRLLFSPPARPRGHDPVAQTFTVQSDGGASVTSVDLFFSEAGNRPVTIELRTTNQGIPSTKILPFSTVTKTPAELNVSSNGTSATTFTFEAPLYLMEGETYALVVKTDEPGCRFFVSEVGKTDTVTGNIITTQPLTGSLYLSQNSLEFEINPLLDLKFNLRKAVYSTTPVTVDLKTATPDIMTLQDNPFTIATGSNKVRVAARNHGFRSNDIVVISNVVDAIYGGDGVNGIPAALLNGQHTVTATGLDKDSFIIEIETTDGNGEALIVGALSDLQRGEYGGSGILMTRQLNMDMAYIKSGSTSVKGTEIAYSINHEQFGINIFKNVVGDANYMFNERQTILSYENQTIVSSSPLVKRSSLRLKATLTTDNPNVSPSIDLQKGAVYVVSNLINDNSQANVNVLELDTTDILTPALESVSVTDTKGSGVGTLTSSTSSTAITIAASGLDITWMADAGDYLLDNSGTFIGEIEEVVSGTSVTLRANAALTQSTAAFQIQNNNHVKFYNLGGKGIIETSFDTADNLIGNASIGKWLYINGMSNQVDGYHQIEDVLVESAEPGRPGNIDGDRVVITLSTVFNVDSVMRLNIASDYFEYYGSGLITTDGTTTVTGSGGSNFTTEVTIGQVLYSNGGVNLGTVASITSATSLELEANSAATVSGVKYAIRDTWSPATYKIQQLDKFVEDYAPSGTYNYANYITRPLYLNEPADSIKIIFDANVPVSSDVDVYYRTTTGTEDILNKIFTNTGFINNTINAESEFTQREITVADVDPYTKISIKIVMKSTNTVHVPKIKNLRLIAYS